MLDRALKGMAEVVAPPRCSACAAPMRGGEPICSGCLGRLASVDGIVEPGPEGIDLAVAVGEYLGTVRELVAGLKFGRRLTAARIAADWIERNCPADELDGALVPVPAAPLRRRWRGFDPAEEIALALAASTGLEFNACLRREQGPRQTGRPRRVRLASPPRVHLRGRAPFRALLVDDVHTTGATLGACARALRAGGCSEVVALTLARAR